ncbi:hypothetical protein [Streptomyces tendae]|uniref:hypothetical protein n=1 Tax=Streptomyces tendae TaxID=1932 RepID=UPI0036F9A300
MTAAPVEASALGVVGGVRTPGEYDLSRALLGRLVDGTTTVGKLVAWRRTSPRGRSVADPLPG